MKSALGRGLLLALAFPAHLLAQGAEGHTGMYHSLAGRGPDAAAVDAMIEMTRRGTQRFADRRAAVAAGYRRVGMDFPSMGEHWINPSMLIGGHFDPGTPAILTYAAVNGVPRLLGVVYAVALVPGESPPVIPGAVWHEHNGSIDEESLLPEHGGDQHGSISATKSQGTRLAILHAWTIVPNPAGMFAAENWALPFLRNGIGVPPAVPRSAARALALVNGGEEYYRKFFSLPSVDSGAATNQRESALRFAMERARAIVVARKDPAAFSADELSSLAEVWERLTVSLSGR